MNKVVLLGRLTKDPEVRYTPSQKVVCSFTLAVDRPFLNQEGKREADFIPVVVWGKAAELCGNSLAKGHRLLVEGRVQVRTYEDKNTNKTVWMTEVVADRIEFIERKADIKTAATSEKNSIAFDGLGKEVPFDQEVTF
ncbi:MAG: single-stranded DNA-binding protein [Acidaminococcaceae bacterium]|nr:single-stranded DNA-binding protein [Acidaminococcaceae bacterium]